MRKLVPLATLLMVALGGCGGGGGSKTTPTVDHPTFQIAWPARSRDPLAHNLTSAQSALVTLVHADPSGSDAVVRVDRDPAKDGAYTGTYTVPQIISRSFSALTATFYAAPAEAGDLVGTATANVTVGSNSINLASVAVVGTIKTISVIDPGSLTANAGATQLFASAKNDQDAAVAVTPGSVFWNVTSGGSITVTKDGLATPIAAGASTVVATVDGVASIPATITVNSANINEPNFSITWPARTRDALKHTLTSALSAEVTLVNAAPNGADVVVKVNRDQANPAAHTETYAVGQPVKSTFDSLVATFYSDPGAEGDIVGTASAAVHPNGSNLSITNIVVDGKIKSVNVINSGPFTVGDAGVQIFAEALDGTLNPIAVTAGSVKWTVISGGTHMTITKDGVATAVKAGDTTVKATIDGVVSPTATLTVQSGATGPELQTIDLSTAKLTYNAATGKIWASILADDATYANCVVSIDPTTGVIGDKTPVGTTPGYIAVSDDGKYAYVSVSNTQVRRLNLTTHTVDTTFTVDEGRAYYDLAAVPGMPKSFAVAIDPIGGVNLSVWDDGVRRPGTGAVGYKIHFVSSTSVLGDGHDSLFVDTLGAGDITWTQSPVNVSGMDYADGKIFNRDGKVIDATTKSTDMTFDTTHFLIDRVLSASSDDNRVYFATWDFGKDKRILSFNKTTGTEMPVTSTGIFIGGVDTIVACGNHTAVFQLFGSGVKRTPVIVRNLP